MTDNNVIRIDGRDIKCSSCGTTEPSRLPTVAELVFELSKVSKEVAAARPIFCRPCSLRGVAEIFNDAVAILDDPAKGETQLQRLEEAWIYLRPQFGPEDLADGPLAGEVHALRLTLIRYFSPGEPLPGERATEAASASMRRLRDSLRSAADAIV